MQLRANLTPSASEFRPLSCTDQAHSGGSSGHANQATSAAATAATSKVEDADGPHHERRGLLPDGNFALACAQGDCLPSGCSQEPGDEWCGAHDRNARTEKGGRMEEYSAPFSIRRARIAALPLVEDRELLSMLMGGEPYSSFGYLDSYDRGPTTFSLSFVTAETLLPRLLRTGRFFVPLEMDERDKSPLAVGRRRALEICIGGSRQPDGRVAVDGSLSPRPSNEWGLTNRCWRFLAAFCLPGSGWRGWQRTRLFRGSPDFATTARSSFRRRNERSFSAACCVRPPCPCSICPRNGSTKK